MDVITETKTDSMKCYFCGELIGANQLPDSSLINIIDPQFRTGKIHRRHNVCVNHSTTRKEAERHVEEWYEAQEAHLQEIITSEEAAAARVLKAVEDAQERKKKVTEPLHIQTARPLKPEQTRHPNYLCRVCGRTTEKDPSAWGKRFGNSYHGACKQSPAKKRAGEQKEAREQEQRLAELTNKCVSVEELNGIWAVYYSETWSPRIQIKIPEIPELLDDPSDISPMEEQTLVGSRIQKGFEILQQAYL